jgi:hypothetical protein
MSLVSFIKFILRYFIVFEAVAYEIVSLISFLVCVVLVYRKATDFCMLILYPANLPKEFMISSSFLVEFLGSLSYRIKQIGIVWLLPSLFESLLFLALILLTWVGIPKLYWIGVEKADSPISFLTWRGMVSVGLSYIVFIVLRNIPSFLVSSLLLLWKGVGFCQRLFLCLLRGSCSFCVASVYTLYYIYGFTYVEPAFHPWNETDLVMVYDLFDVLLNSVCQCFVASLCIKILVCNLFSLFCLVWNECNTGFM